MEVSAAQAPPANNPGHLQTGNDLQAHQMITSAKCANMTQSLQLNNNSPPAKEYRATNNLNKKNPIPSEEKHNSDIIIEYHQLPIMYDQLTDDGVREIIQGLINRVAPESGISNPSNNSAVTEIAPVSTAIVSSDERTVALTTVDEPVGEERSKEMVVLRNLEITPPPQICEPGKEEASIDTEDGTKPIQTKRRLSSPQQTDANEPTESSGRSKRQRTQTKLFQAGDSAGKDRLSTSMTSASQRRSLSRGRQESTASTTSEENLSNADDSLNQSQKSNDSQDVIYEKNHTFAVRNEVDTFYLCQIAERSKPSSPFVKVRWLDTNDGNQTFYYTSQYDKVPHQSIIMPVTLTKLKGTKSKSFFKLSEQDRDIIMERLKRVLNYLPGAVQDGNDDNMNA